MATVVKCPTCRRPVEWSAESPYRPFCSDRCRLIDLGAWLTEQRKIPDEGGPEGEGVRADGPASSEGLEES
ncbi:MAG: DNA gyrase inhibitor YacG [Pseudomonadota bacterium]|nr:DNA gyrase inhibitor YacG [Pseudomonadota bacterium]